MTEGIKVLVCGGRDFADKDTLTAVLDELNIAVIVHGAAKGADTLADDYAKERQIPVKRHPANWNKHGLAAGYIRNQQMLVNEQPDLVVAFLGRNGKGTEDMVRRAIKAGIGVRVSEYA